VLENHANPTVSLSGTFRAGEYFNPAGKDGLRQPDGEHAQQGNDAPQQDRDRRGAGDTGARISFSSNTFTVSVGGQALSRDLPMLLATTAEELRIALLSG
jgi:zinc protease